MDLKGPGWRGRHSCGCTSPGRAPGLVGWRPDGQGRRWPFLREGCLAPGPGPAGRPRDQQLPSCGAWGRVVGWRDQLVRDCVTVPPDRPLSRRCVPPMQGAQGLRRICRHPVRPVLKHGPRSLTCAQVIGLYEPHRRNESEGGHWPFRWDPRPRGGAHHRPVSPALSGRRSKSVHVGTRKMVNYA